MLNWQCVIWIIVKVYNCLFYSKIRFYYIKYFEKLDWTEWVLLKRLCFEKDLLWWNNRELDCFWKIRLYCELDCFRKVDCYCKLDCYWNWTVIVNWIVIVDWIVIVNWIIIETGSLSWNDCIDGRTRPWLWLYCSGPVLEWRHDKPASG